MKSKKKNHRKALPATTFSEILERTSAQQAKISELEALGWIVVTEPEGTFNGAMLLEGPDCHVFVQPDGSIEGDNDE